MKVFLASAVGCGASPVPFALAHDRTHRRLVELIAKKHGAGEVIDIAAAAEPGDVVVVDLFEKLKRRLGLRSAPSP